VYTEEYFLSRCGGVGAFKKGEIGPRYQQALSYLKPRSGESILDVGCGRGEIIKECKKKGCIAIGIDYSKAAVKISKNYVKGIIIRASGTHLPFRNDVFDAITLIDVIEHLDKFDTHNCLSELHRVLKTNGRILVRTPNGWAKYYRFPLSGIYNLVLHERFPCFEFHVDEKNPVSIRRFFSCHDLKAKRVIQIRLGRNVRRMLGEVYGFLDDLWYWAYKK